MSFPHIRPFRFGVQCSRASSRSEWIDLARRTEANGFDCLTMPDHFTDQLAPVPALQAVADATTTLRVGALVWDNDYKHPVVLAKELATIDLLSEGRLEIGIGAGWMISDYEQAGIPYDAAGVRIDRFIEGLEIIKRSMNDGAFSFSGKHYTISNYDGLPKPVQRPCPPILIGGGGKRVLSFAAREADIIGINGTMTAGVVGPDAISSMTADAVEEKVNIVRTAAGPRLADIEMNIRAFFVKVTDDAAGTISGMAQMIGVEPTMVADTPFALIGPVSKIVDDLLARRERWGFSYVIVGAEDVDSFAPVVAALNGK
ncbi:MAG: TIGR03621 family F420-dependent LLM class oxidoreductase [Acidobacteria bacterium]|nr:TIGR03621 family F420-dependent LLM class oxidoreductase [Acidobacteriota bacterium]